MASGIYCIRNTVNQRVYIGSAINIEGRWATHRCSLRNNNHHSTTLQRSWNKYGEDGFEFIVLEEISESEDIDNSYLTDVEQLYFDAYRPFAKEKRGFNELTVAGSMRGHKFSKKIRENMSKAHIGKKAWNKGIKHTEEAKTKMRGRTPWSKGKTYKTGKPSWNSGKKIDISDSHKEKLISHIKKNLTKTYIGTSPDGCSVLFKNASQFAKENGFSPQGITGCAKGRRPHHKGWKFSYYEPTEA